MHKLKALIVGALISTAVASQAAVITEYSNTGSIVLTAAQYITIDNPLTLGGAISDADQAGSLFFGVTCVRTSDNGFSTIGIYSTQNNSSADGGVDIGRNTNVASFAAFDYLDNKNANSTTAQVIGSPTVSLKIGTYQIIGEIEFTSATTGIIRAWVWDGTNGSLALGSPNVTTTFTSGFSGTPADLYLKLNTGAGSTTFSNINVTWAETSEDRAAAFAAVPEPSSYALLAGAGMLGLGLAARRQRKIAASGR